MAILACFCLGSQRVFLATPDWNFPMTPNVCLFVGWLVGRLGRQVQHPCSYCEVEVKIVDDHSCDFQIRVVVNTQEL